MQIKISVFADSVEEQLKEHSFFKETKKRLIDADELIAYIKDLPTWWADAGGTYGPSMKYPDGMFDVNDVINSIESMVDERAGDKD